MAGSLYAAKLRTPFAVLGIRTAGGKVTAIEYLSRSAARTGAFRPRRRCASSNGISPIRATASRCRSRRAGRS